jgi:hypothetical protein
MLKDDVILYSKLTGNDGLHTPIAIIGAYLDGDDKGKVEQPKKGRWISARCAERRWREQMMSDLIDR